MSTKEGQLLWEPSEKFAADSQVSRFISWLREREIIDCANYGALWQWSVSETEAFWASLWEYFEVQSDTPYSCVVDSLEMKPGNQWFPGARLNLAEHILRNEQPGKTALHHMSETRMLTEMDWSELAGKVRILATRMRAMGIQPGDAVCCLMPNIPETVIAMLATISVGAVWSNAAPEFGRQTVLDRFTQINPKWLFVVDGYQFGGKAFDRSEDVYAIVEALEGSLEQVVYLPYLNQSYSGPNLDSVQWAELLTGEDPGNDSFLFERVAHNHPLWVLFSSGTTGLPKAIVHSHVGALMGLMKLNTFHFNLGVDDTSFFYTTTGWVMFNVQVTMLFCGAGIVLYDGNPVWPEPGILWKMAEETGATSFGASPSYVQLMEQNNITPCDQYNLTKLHGTVCSGSPTTPENFAWFYENVKKDLWVTSLSGGTEVLSAFVGGVPTEPVRAGEIQSRLLGMDVAAWDENGEELIDEVGELVCKTPFPSMPIYFLNDENNVRYQDAYFNDYPGAWRHGDFIKINRRGGSYIHGRSDSTLNRYGIRIGTAELYRAVESLPEVDDSLVVCIELPGGKFFMPMFLALADGIEMTDALQAKIVSELRTQCSPRHVPDKFYAIGEIPYTLTGKKLEVPIRKLMLGWPEEKSVSRDTMRNPQVLDYFLDYIDTTKDYKLK